MKKDETKLNLELNLKAPGIKFYIEEPEVVIKREIRRAIWIVAAVLVITAILIAVAVYKIKQMTPSLTTKQNAIYQASQTNVVDQNLLNNWEETKPILEKISQALPDPTNLLDYQAALEKAAANAGLGVAVNFSSANTSSASKISGTDIVEHQVQVKGDANSINEFLTNVEKLPFYVTLTKFSITFSRGSANEASANLTFKLFTLAKNKPTQNIASPSPTVNNLEIKQ